MLRNIKVLGLALVAVLAMSALAASAASAAEFHSSEEVTELAAGQLGVHEFVVNTGVVVCEEASFTGTQVGKSTETVTIDPSYGGCEFEGLFTVTVSVNGCQYVFHASSATEGTVDIAGCNEAVPYIQVGSTLTCRVRVSEQSGKGPVTYSTNTKVVGETIHHNTVVTSHTEELVYSESGLFCEGGPVNNGTYEGASEVEGNGGKAELSVS